MIIFRSIHIAIDDKISFVLWLSSITVCVCVCVCVCAHVYTSLAIHLLMVLVRPNPQKDTSHIDLGSTLMTSL